VTTIRARCRRSALHQPLRPTLQRLLAAVRLPVAPVVFQRRAIRVQRSDAEHRLACHLGERDGQPKLLVIPSRHAFTARLAVAPCVTSASRLAIATRLTDAPTHHQSLGRHDLAVRT